MLIKLTSAIRPKGLWEAGPAAIVDSEAIIAVTPALDTIGIPASRIFLHKGTSSGDVYAMEDAEAILRLMAPQTNRDGQSIKTTHETPATGQE